MAIGFLADGARCFGTRKQPNIVGITFVFTILFVTCSLYRPWDRVSGVAHIFFLKLVFSHVSVKVSRGLAGYNLDNLDMNMQYGTGPTSAQVDYGLLVHSQMCRYSYFRSGCSAQMCSERAGE